MDHADDDVLTLKEAAALLRVHPVSTLTRMEAIRPLNRKGDEMGRPTQLRLKGIPLLLWPQARRYANAGDAEGFFGSTDSMLSMYLLSRNWAWFHQRSLAAKALLEAWSNQKVAYQWESFMRQRLVECDRAELLRWSDPFPEGDTYTLYRGVQGKSNPRGLSWTTSLSVAEHFANRVHGNGTVYMATVKRKNVYARIHESGREEHEMLVLSIDDVISRPQRG